MTVHVALRHFAAFAVCVACLLTALTAHAEPIGTMTLEGQLLTVAGSPVPDGDYTIKVAFYPDKQAVKSLHSETAQIKLVGGGFVLTLGLDQPLKSQIFTDGEAAWVGIQVGTEKELPRLPINHVAYAWRADVALAAKALQCSGCLKAEHLDSAVLAPYALKADLKFVAADQGCPSGEHVVSFGADGKVTCAKAPSYGGGDFALSKQSCAVGELVAGVDDQGKLKCAVDGGATYDGKNFALSGQKCGAGQVVQDIDAEGKVVCVANPSAVLKGEQVNNLAKNKLADGTAPWADPKAHAHGYDVDSPWLHDADDNAHVKLFGGKRQLVMRTDGTDEYNTGVGAHPFVWMFGGDVAVNRLMLLDVKGQIWANGYGWLHERFAATKTQCPKGQVMRGVLGTGAPDCVVDQDSETVFKATDGVKLVADTFSADLPFLDKRFVNQLQKDAISSAMIIDGQVALADLAADAVNGSKVVDGSLGSADIANEALTGADIKDGTLTGADIKDGALTGADVQDKSLSAADVDPASVQVRVEGACPDGQAIRAIGSDGKVTCVAETGSAFTKFAGAVKVGRWYRIASSANGAQVAGTFHIYEASYGGSLAVRVGISKSAEAAMDVALLHHSHAGTAVFSQMRVVENGPTNAHFIDLKANKDASVWLQLTDNSHGQPWKAESWVDQGTADAVSGWNNRAYELDKLLMVGADNDRLSVLRNGVTRVRTPFGYLELGAQDANYAHSLTDRPKFFFNKGLRIDEGIVSSHNENLAFQTSGTTRGYFDNSNGWLFTTLGAQLCLSNPAGCGLTVSDDGGFYDHNDGWIRNQVTYGLLIRDKANKEWRDLQARHIIANGNLVSTGGLSTDGAATIKGDLQVNGKATVNSTLTVGSTVAANNGVSVDGQTVIDNDAGWHRTYGKTGWINQTYGGGVYMEDATWVRVYGNKSFFSPSTLRADGYLGVGGDPSYPLHVVKSKANDWSAVISSGASNVYLTHPGGYGMHINTGQADNKGGYLLEVRNAAGQAIYVPNNRRVGIATASPEEALHVNGNLRVQDWLVPSGNTGIRWRDNIWGGGGDLAYIQYLRESGENTKLRILNDNDPDDDIELYQMGAPRLNIYNGNVGIGTTTPDYKLKVNGTGHFAGELTAAANVDVKGELFRKVQRRAIYAYDSTTNGIVASRTFTFTKQRSDTSVLIHWYDNFRCAGNAVACRWDVRIDGHNCKTPGRIRQDMYNDPSTNHHYGQTVMGVCQVLANGASIGAGKHTITIVEGPSPSHNHGGPVLGWNWANNDGTTSLITVEEIY